MVGLAIFALLMLAVGVGVLMAVQGLTGTVDIISTRNFFLLGFINFQLTSAAITLIVPVRESYVLRNIPTTAAIYVIYVIIFLYFFTFAYRKGWLVSKLASRTPVAEAAPGVVSMLTLAVAFLAVGIVFRYVLGYVPILGVLTAIVGEGLLAAAAGLAMWAYAPRLFNVWVGGIAGGIILVALAASLYQTFGRRGVLGVMACVVWGAYHGHWKYLDRKRVMMLLMCAGVVGFLMMSAITGTRSGGSRDATAADLIRLLNGSAVKQGVVLVATGQEAANNSMWLMENYPEPFEYRPLETLVYFLVHPVPRQFWAGKPDGLGRIAVRQAKAGKKKGKNYSIGPGLLGHIHRDNPWLSLIPYAILYGLMFRFMDQIVRLHPANPFVVLPVGVALGQIIGIPRGEVGLFTFQTVANVISTGVGMFLVAKTLQTLGWRMRSFEEEAADEEVDDNWDEDIEPDESHDIQDTSDWDEHEDSDSYDDY